jgi:cation transporter-like permease
MVLFLSFAGFPLIVSIGLSVWVKNSISQIIMAAASLLYGGWFAYAVYDAFYVNLDPQSPLIIIFVGIYALPILLLLWTIAAVIHVITRRQPSSAG